MSRDNFDLEGSGPFQGPLLGSPMEPREQSAPHFRQPEAPLVELPPYQPPMPMVHTPAAVGEIPGSTQTHLLGASLLLPALGAVVGMRFDPVYGSIGGGLAAGSTINAYRAIRASMQGNAEDDKEALISGTYAVIGLVAAGYLLFKAHGNRKAKMNAPVDDEDDELRGVE